MENTVFFVKPHGGQEALKAESRQCIFLKLVVIVLLCATTAGFFSAYERYEFSGENILENAGFQQGLKNWDKKFSAGSIAVDGQGVLRIHSQDDHELMYVRQYLGDIQGYRFLQFTGEMRTDGVEPGKKPWQVAHLAVIGIDAMGKKLWREPYLLAKQHGTNDWQHYEKVFKLNGDAEEFLVSIQLSMVKGAVWAKKLSLRPLSEKPAYEIYWIIAVSLWLLVISWILTDYFRNYGFSLKQAPGAFLLGGIAVGILMPHHIITQLNDILLSLFSWAPDAVPLANWIEFADMYSIWHFLSFASLSLVIYRHAASFGRLAQISGLLVLFALVTEVLQLLVDSRKSEQIDFVADVAGIVTALILWSVWRATRLVLGRMILFLNKRQA